MKGMLIVQCWDDGVVDDIRLTEILRRYGARAAFSLNPGAYGPGRSYGWRHEDKDVWRLGRDELASVYDDFEIASHSLTHPNLADISCDLMEQEIRQSRMILEDIFQKSVYGFCYPFDVYNDAVKNAVRAAGYRWARGNQTRMSCFPPDDPMEFHPSCHFLSDRFRICYESAKKDKGVFFFWGHSYELMNEVMWTEFERTIESMASDSDAEWCDLSALFLAKDDAQ